MRSLVWILGAAAPWLFAILIATDGAAAPPRLKPPHATPEFIGAWSIQHNKDEFEEHWAMQAIEIGSRNILTIDCRDGEASLTVNGHSRPKGIPIAALVKAGDARPLFFRVDLRTWIPRVAIVDVDHIESALPALASAHRIAIRIKGTRGDTDYFWTVNDGTLNRNLAAGKAMLARICPSH